MKRIQIQVDEQLDAAVTAEARRRGVSKAELVRASLKRELSAPPTRPGDPWEARRRRLDGTLVEDVDEVLFGPVG
jgi:hypothetical protein